MHHADAWKEVWSSLGTRTQDWMRNKARWEGRSLSSVMREWWPKLWERVEKRSKELFEATG